MCFIWESEHEEEFKQVIANFSDLQKLSAYNPENQLMALTDASVQGLGFILFQKGSQDKKWSIVWAGSTCLKASQPCWCPSELELLSVFFCLKKCHHFTFNSRHPVIVHSDCSGIKGFEFKDLLGISIQQMADLKVKMSEYWY